MKANQKGQILILVFIALGIVLFTVLFIISGAQIYFQNASYATDAEKATALAEAGIDKALASLNSTGGSYSGESETALEEGVFSVSITSQDAGTKLIQSTGYVPDKSKPKAKRTIKISSSRGVGVSFVYGIQVGEGGLLLGNSNVVKGSIYSNGSISAGNNNSVTGDIWVAGGPQGSSDQEADCTDSNCQDFIFGRVWEGNSRFDAAQSFQPSSSGALNKVSLKLYKVGNPSDVTVRIMGDSNGKPDKNNVLATGTLYSSLVTVNPPGFGFIDVTFNTMPLLTANTTYWIMIDTSGDSSNYWVWQKDLAQGYTRGGPAWSGNWSTGNPAWNLFNEDLSFKTVMGGGITSVTGGSDFSVRGNVHANTITGLTIARDAYYQTISNSTVGGQSYPGSSDPAPKVFPISDANVTDWKNQVDKPETTTYGDITSCVSTLGPRKIVGNVNINSNCVITIKSPIWITGNLTLNSNNNLKLDPTYGSTSGVMVVDGTVNLGSNNKLEGTGVGSSLLMVLSTYDSVANGGASAIVVSNTGNSGVYYASKGIIEPGNHNNYKELTAWGIKLVHNSTIDYETGLSSTLFSSGPSGSYSLVKGTYQVK
ncbi:hypothetical protein HYS95_00580 [Candidatus Daviesbacteria bacterium]|nr:hypothetical protein [Candidatus Daviesbacteria bacterium]